MCFLSSLVFFSLPCLPIGKFRFMAMNGRHGADAVAERKVPGGGDPAELVLDAGFVVPDANAFGNTFR